MNRKPAPSAFDPRQTALRLTGDLTSVREKIITLAEARMEGWRAGLANAALLEDTANLAHYLALRSLDLRNIQPALSSLGLSSLGRSESRVLPAIDAVLATLARISGEKGSAYPDPQILLNGHETLERRKTEVFGRDPEGPSTRIMVTLPTEAAADPQLVQQLIANGADCARINCAHDGPDVWLAMIGHVRSAAEKLGRDVRIAMDLGGPKFRIEAIGTQEKVRLHRGDRFALAVAFREGSDVIEATLSPPQLLEYLAPAAMVWINDGKIGARVVSVEPGRAVLEVTHAREKGERLKPEKGVNLPGAELDLPALTEQDIADLDVVAEHADIIGYSFVQTPEDVRHLAEQVKLRRGSRPMPALMLKIETPLAVRNLPHLIVQAGGMMPVAVMIARGDLAVEIGLERLSEIQEEILWLCEAAHVPVVWATQVLDTMVKNGTPSRAETTDAAMGQRAECVMLNKGPHLAGATAFLDRVLRRMDRHQSKKSPQLGPLRSWQDIPASEQPAL
ncbi:pyruvate kinase [Aestuariivirga sp.]|uniref:pyruvate kinase n=1 Tax=Aestuariivirga sp. TaxID=2650926 RepID=UPI003BAD1D9D